MQPNRIPNDAGRDVVILVAKHVANRGDVRPRNVGVLGLEFARYLSRGLGDDLNASFDSALGLSISEVLFESQVSCVCPCLRDAVDHFFDNDIQRAAIRAR